MKTRLTILLFFFSFVIQAQQINTIEYFFDTDPGFGNGSQLPANSATLDSNFNLTIPSLPAGLHTLFVRLKNSDNKWSTVYQGNIFIVNGIGGAAQITTVEYFFDTDPGFGNGTQLTVNSASLDSMLNFTIAAMPAGLHTLYVRLKNSDDKWSTVYQGNIFIVNGIGGNEQIIKAEYFYDTDPGIGNGTSISLNNTSLDSTLPFSVTGLSSGNHSLFVRLQNSSNNWGATYQHNFLVWPGNSGTPQIESLQYFIDTVGNSFQLPLNLSGVLDTTMSVNIPDNGADTRKLGLQLKNNTGETGNATLIDISLCDLYKPQGGFRHVQYGNIFSLIDTSRFNTSNKVDWLVNNVPFNSGYTVNYTFPNPIGSANITQLTGTGCRTDSVTQIFNLPGIENYSKYGSYNSDFDLHLYGGGLDTNAIIFMQKGDTIVYPYTKFGISPQELIAFFDFHIFPKTFGTQDIFENYILHVTFSNGQSFVGPYPINMVKEEAYDGCNGAGPKLSRCHPANGNGEPYFAIDLAGNSSLRTGVWSNQTFTITNTGSVVAKEIPFFFVLPAHYEIDTTRWNVYDNNNPGLRDSLSILIPVDTIINGQRIQYTIVGLIEPILGPGEKESIPIRIRTSHIGESTIIYWADYRMFGSPAIAIFPPCWASMFDLVIGFVPGLGCISAGWDFGNASQNATTNPFNKSSTSKKVGSVLLTGASTALKCLPGGIALSTWAKVSMAKVMSNTDPNTMAAVALYGVPAAGLVIAGSSAALQDPCEKAKQIWKKKTWTERLSYDPNHLSGNSDFDTSRNFINNYSPQNYQVEFENKPIATANAQHVLVTDTLNPQKFDFTTFTVNSFTISDSVYFVPPYRNNITIDVGLKIRKDMKVRFAAEFDTATGILKADFFSIDTTGQVLPLDSLEGFLPPNTDGVSGTGAVSYSLYARDMNTLDTFSNRATIYFDANAFITTNTWINTVDTTAPQATIVNSIRINDTTINLVIQQSDIGSGLWYNTLYGKQPADSVFQTMGIVRGDTITFKGNINQTFQLFVKASDNVGNEQKKSTADITVSFTTPLPLTWLSFTGSLSSDKVQLKWVTSNEINTARFDIEKSTDGIQFTKIAMVPAKGNTAQNNDYISWDDHPAKGNNYYRLKQFDKDGSFSKSSIVRVNYVKDGFVMIAPNPAKNYVTISGSSKFTQIQLIDGAGRVTRIYNTNVSGRYSLAGLSSGLYYLKLINSSDTQTFKLQIE